MQILFGAQRRAAYTPEQVAALVSAAQEELRDPLAARGKLAAALDNMAALGSPFREPESHCHGDDSGYYRCEDPGCPGPVDAL